MKNCISLIILILSSCNVVQTSNTAEKEIIKFQKDLNVLYYNPDETPLRGKFYDNFQGHPFYPINLKYRIFADLERISNAEPFEMPTSSGKTKKYLAYAKVSFRLENQKHSLIVYQNQRLKEDPQYKNHLFLPFYDGTNGTETYEGGRYIDLSMPVGDKILIDFNKAYQPYCAYNLYDYSCPLVPIENQLQIPIPAGVKYNAADFKQ